MVVEPRNQLPPFQTRIELLEVCELISGRQISPVAPPEVMGRHFICGSVIARFAGLGINVVPYPVRAITITVHAILEGLVSGSERSPRVGPEMVVRAFVKHCGLGW